MSRVVAVPAVRAVPRPAPVPKLKSPAPEPILQEQRAARGLGGLIAWLRGGERTELPFRRELEQRVRGDLSGIESYRGERARRIADTVGARAFAVGNVVGFTAERPSFADVAHEVAHVVQMLGPSPQPWRGVYPIGVAPWNSPYELPGRTSATGLTDQARGVRAPIAIYRNDKKEKDPQDTDPGTLETDVEKALLALMRSMYGIREERFSKEDAPYSVRDNADVDKQIFVESSAQTFKRRQLLEIGYPAGTKEESVSRDLREKIFGGQLLARKSGLVVDGRRPRMVKVRYQKDQETLAEYAFVGVDHTGEPIETEEVFARRGRPDRDRDKDAQHPKVTLEHYGLIFKRIKEVAGDAGKTLDKVVAVETTTLQNALDRAANPDNKSDDDLRAELDPLVEDVRHEFVVAMARSYSEMEDLHDQAFASDVFRQKPFLGSGGNSPYQRFKAHIFETWLADRGRKNFDRVTLPKTNEEKVVQPVFAERASNKYLKSTHLLKVRHGDGVLRMKDTDLRSYYSIAEAKAYTDGPKGPEIEQMQDYARIITIPIKGYFEVRVGDKLEPTDFEFKHITYFFSNIKVAGEWLPTLDEHLGDKYTADPDPRKKVLTTDERIKEVEESIKRLEAANTKGRKDKKSTLVGIDTVKADLEALKAKPNEDERKTGLDAIEDKLAKAVVDSYKPSIGDVYDRALEDDKVFPPSLSAIAAKIVEGWIVASGRRIDTTLESPPHGERRKVRPLFDTPPIEKPESTWGKAVIAGTGDLDILDARLMIDKTAATAGPTGDDVPEMEDVKKLQTKDRIFLVVKGGAGPRFVPRVLKQVEYQFAPDGEEIAKLWLPELERVFGKRLGDDVFISPDPKADKKAVLRFALNPTFEAKVADASTLTPPVTITSEHPGIVVDKVEVTLTAVRKPEISSGSITFGLVNEATKGVISSEAPETKPIVPASSPAKTKEPIHGRVENRLSGLRSKLDGLLKRIRTDAKLITNGVEASLRVTAGSSGIPKVDLEEAVITATVKGSKKGPVFALKGAVGISTAKGKIKGRLEIEYKNGALAIGGKVRVENLIDGLAPVDAAVTYKAATESEKEKLEITIVEADFKKRLGAVTIGGKARNLKYDFNDSSFSGEGELSAELGSFGKAKVGVTIDRNVLSRAELEYATDFRYPKTGTALITGRVKGVVIYEAGEFSGGVKGDAVLAIPALKKLSKDPIALTAEVMVNSEGELSGGFEVAAPVKLGDHFHLERLGAKINEKGQVSASFTISIRDIPIVAEGTVAWISCEIDENKGFRVVSANIHLPFGKANESRFWGFFDVKYEKEAFVVTLAISVKLKKGMVAEGTLTYNTETRVVSGTLKLPRIPLLTYEHDGRTIFQLGPKQISIIQIPGLGLYIDIDFALKFGLAFDLSALPSVQLKDFDLKTKEFKGASAAVQIVGKGLMAKLVAEPRIGIGAFAFHPKILRGGGGIRVPIEGIAKLEPSKDTVAYFSYLPAQGDEDAKVTAGARIAFRVTFAVDAKITPWAEFVVLDGLYEAPWVGQPLASFPLLPERELFTFAVNFGEPIEHVTDPELPTSSKSPPSTGVKTFPSKQHSGGAQVQEEEPDLDEEVEPGKERPEAGAEKGFDIKSLVKGIVGDGAFAVVWDLIKAVAETIEKIKKRVRLILKLFKKLFANTYQALINFLRGLKAADYKLFTYIVSILGKRIDPTLFYILEPILLLFTTREDALYDLIEAGVPTTTRGWIDFALNLLTLLTPLAWDAPLAIAETIYRLVRVIAAAIADAIKRLIAFLVKEGLLGARENHYYLGSKTIEGALDYIGIGADVTYDFWAPDEWKAFGRYYPPDRDWPFYELSQAPAAALWGVLWFCDAPKNSHGDYWF